MIIKLKNHIIFPLIANWPQTFESFWLVTRAFQASLEEHNTETVFDTKFPEANYFVVKPEVI